MSAIMIIDCGTTNLRVTICDNTGLPFAVTRRAGGVRHTAIDGHNGRLKAMLREAIDEALSAAHLTYNEITACVAYGMITSNVGLLEIPHLAAPSSAAALHQGMRTAVFDEIAPFPIAFIPGVRNFGGTVSAENFSGMDMMRGEETESIGLWQLLKPQKESVFVLPGSHNKFVRMDPQGRILGCMTSISGELLDAVTHHTILADAVGREFAYEADYDAGMAQQGALECARSGLGRAAFAGRILHQLGGESSVRLRSYLLGAVLAQDVLALRTFMGDSFGDTAVYIAGKMPLRKAFADVMLALGLPNAQQIPEEISARMGISGALTVLSAESSH